MDKTNFVKNVIFLFVIFCFSSCSFFAKNIKTQCNNLFLVYMAGDNSLNKTVYSDFEELKNGLQSENDIILVLADRYSSNFYEDEWNEARLFQISYENNEINVVELEDENLGISLSWLDDDIDTGSEEILTCFLEYAKKNYESSKIYLDLWNHGGGWKSGDLYTETSKPSSRNICFDENTDNSLSLKELSSAIKNSGINHFDIILMDACSMACIEVASALLELTDTVIFSQDTIPEAGMPYDKIIPVLFSNKKTDDKCSQICELYMNSYENQTTTFSAIKIDEDNGLENFLIEFEKHINNFTDFENIKNDRPYCFEFLTDVIDINIFFDECLKSDFDKILIKNCSDCSDGMSIFFPEYFSYSKDSWEYTSERLNFLKLCPSYLEFLQRIQKENSSSLVTDLYEPNNYQIDAFKLTKSEHEVSSYLWCISDEDWYVFDNSEKI